ncbi:MAG: penicillin-binding protein 2 [Lachnospiraceae bacterium]|nr:penicillin-binding protein 2 [Lachnospiraceae bacterium]
MERKTQRIDDSLTEEELLAIEARRRRRRRANREMNIIVIFFSSALALMLIFMSYYVYARAPKEITSSYNPRQKNLEQRVIRGKIFASDGEVLAEQAMDGDKEVRYYPEHELYAHAVGFSTHGVQGMERLANISLLTSNAPVKERLEKEMEGARNYGDYVYTTFEPSLQKAAYDALGVYKGAVAVMEVRTGKILAMVSKPDFDPNDIDVHWDRISADTVNSPLVNRVTQGLYPPGSTFKIATLLEYIRENPETYEDYYFNCKGSFTYGDSSVSCFHGNVHGKVGIHKSFEKSCNSSFANICTLLDLKKMGRNVKKLLFNEELPVDYTHKDSQYVLSESPTDEELLQTSIGQGKTLITPMHLLLITAAIANDGVLMTPYEIERITNYRGDDVQVFSPKAYGMLMSAEEAGIMKNFMTGVVENGGTGRALAGLSYSAAGKTGSAEYGNVKGNSHAWFTGFSNVESPDIAVTVIVEGAGSGGEYAVPIAKRIFDVYYSKGLPQ